MGTPLPTSRPTSEPTWPRRMTRATAEIHPVRTGPETKSSRNPSLRRPTARAKTPTINATAEAISAGEWPSFFREDTASAVRSPRIEVGPVDISVLNSQQFRSPPYVVRICTLEREILPLEVPKKT